MFGCVQHNGRRAPQADEASRFRFSSNQEQPRLRIKRVYLRILKLFDHRESTSTPDYTSEHGSFADVRVLRSGEQRERAALRQIPQVPERL